MSIGSNSQKKRVEGDPAAEPRFHAPDDALRDLSFRANIARAADKEAVCLHGVERKTNEVTGRAGGMQCRSEAAGFT